MGDTFQTIADRDATPQDAARLARPVVEWLVAEGIVLADAEPGWALGDHPAHPPGPHWHKGVTDARGGAPEGVAVHTERTVFHSRRGPLETVHCPRCTATVRLWADGSMIPHTWGPFILAADTWHETGTADVTCPHCAETVPLPDWNWPDDYFAFVHLGFEFWNWPPLSEEFRTRMSELLGGHRTAYVWGKL